MIPDEIRERLVKALLGTPTAQDPAGRTTWLAGIPQRTLTRVPGNDRDDIGLLIQQLEDWFGPAGEWYLLKFIDNAANGVPGTDLGRTLQGIRQELQKTVRPRQANPLEVAQVHLFDLWRPRMACLAQLPPKPAVSGFVLPGATPRLLGYFCDSLKFCSEHAWTRDQVALPGAPFVVDPVTNPVSTAVTKARNVERNLATKHVLWPAFVPDTGDATALWDALNATFAQPLQRHMVVVFGMPQTQAVPAGMLRLPAPMFVRDDVATWAADIVTAKGWRDPLAGKWNAVMVMGYPADAPLPIDAVYERLERHHQLVSRTWINDDELYDELIALEQFGD